MDSSDYGYRSGYRRYEYLLNEDDFGDSMMGGVHFFKEKTPPYQGLPDEKIIGCYRDGKKIAEIWTERGEDYKNPNKVTGYTVYPPWKMGKGAMQGTWDKSFSTMKNPFGHPVYKTPAAALAAAKKFVIGLKTEEVASDATAVVESVEIDEAADRINEQKSDPFNWRKGDRLPIHERNPRTFEVFAGLFDYSGFGMGNYHSKNGRRIWTDRANAERLAKSDGVELVVHDRFKGSL